MTQPAVSVQIYAVKSQLTEDLDGTLARLAGMGVGNVEAYDFGGRSAYEVFVDQLRDDVALEVDLYWAATAKQDVPALLSRLGDRVKALHMKDGIIGADPFGIGAEPLDPTTLDQRPAGQGDLPLLEYLTAAPSTEFAVIEFDHYAGDMFDAIRASVAYLNENGVR